MNRPLVVGLTGGIASGKSTIGRHLRELGATVIDADEVARDVVKPGQPAYRQIVAAFGPSVLMEQADSDGEEPALDRKQLAARVFGDDSARRLLNQITHPAIAAESARRMQLAMQSGATVIVYEAALIVENNCLLYTSMCIRDRVKGEPILGAVPVNNVAYYEDAIRLDYSGNKLFSGVLHATNLITYNISAMSGFVKEAIQEKSVQPVFSKVNSIVAIVDVTHYFVKVDSFMSILNLVAMLSVILAFMNILPIPLFDGGHIFFLIIEKIRGRKISMEMQNKIGQVVFVLLIILTIAIVLKDILQFEWPKRIVGTVSGIIK